MHIRARSVIATLVLLLSMWSTPAAASSAAAKLSAPTPIVVGNLLLDSRSGTQFIPHGVNWPSFEYACAQGWGYSRDTATAATAAAIAAWKANVVRVPLNQDCWLGTHSSPASDPENHRTAAGYRNAVAAFVTTLNAAGLVVILDLHSSTTGGPNIAGQRAMPDAASVTFWSSVAGAFAGNRSVLFDAFNEPYSRWNDATASWTFDLTWSCWTAGGCHAPVEDDYTSTLSGTTYAAAGMAQIVIAIRAAGAHQPILLGGLDYANDLQGWLANRPNDDQLVASFHNYQGQRCSSATCWNAEIAPVAAVVPVVTGEFGETDGAATFMTSYMTWADAHDVGYLAWAWWVLPDASAGTLALLSNDNGTPRAPLGTALRTHLLAIPPPVVTPPVTPPPTGPPGSFVPLTPTRIYDSRSSSSSIGPGGTLTVPVTGVKFVPAGEVSAVAVNVTVTGPTAHGYLTAYPAGTARPTSSILNFTVGQTVAGLAVVPVGVNGKVNLFNGSGGRVQLIVDVAGYYRSGSPSAPGTFVAMTPVRLLDTRTGNGAARAPVPATGTVNLPVSGRAEIPSAAAVAMTVTATGAIRAGYVSVFAGAAPTGSNLNFRAGQTVPNLTFAPLNAAGKAKLYNGSAGSVELLADVSGCVLPGTAMLPGAYRSVTPARILDTRTTSSPALTGQHTLGVTVSGRGGLPLSGVAAVVINLTVANPVGAGFLTAYPSGTSRPGSSNLNFVRGTTVANLAVVPVGADGKIDLYNGSTGGTAVIADIQGYFLS